MITTYRASAIRSGDWWAIEVPDVAVHTQAKRLDQAANMAREAIALVLDVDEVGIDVEVDVDHHWLNEAGLMLDDWDQARADARLLKADADAAARQTARYLRWDGYSMRDIAKLMDVSFQRVHQLVNEDPPNCPVCGAAGEWVESTRISHGTISRRRPPREVQVVIARCSADPDHWRYEGPSFDDLEPAPSAAVLP